MNKKLMALAVGMLYCHAAVEGVAESASAAPAPAANNGGGAVVAPTAEENKEPTVTVLTAEGEVLPTKYKFHFKKDKVGEKRPTIELSIDTVTYNGLLKALEDPKQAEYILDVLAQEQIRAARVQVGDETNPVNTQEQLKADKLSIKALAYMPKAERTGGGISKETWEEMFKDYIEVMPGITGKNAEQVGNAAKLLLAKFQPVKTNKKVIGFLQGQLAQWYAATPNQEDFAECYEFLENKAKTLLEADEAALLANL